MRRPRWYRPESDRYLHLDLLRFAASVSIVLFHYRLLMDGPAGWRVGFMDLAPLRLAVDLFFIISGIVMSELYRGRLPTFQAYKGFLQKRIARLIPLHYATLLFMILLGVGAAIVGLTPANPETFDSRCILPNLLMLHSTGACPVLSYNGPSWSISAEFLLYLALPGLLIVSERPKLSAALCAILLLAFFMLDRLGAWPWTERTYNLGALRAIPSFIFGLTLSRIGPRVRRIPVPRALTAICAVAFLAECALPVTDVTRMLTIYALVTFAYAADVCGRASGPVRALAPLGRLTYSMYMLHMPLSLVLISLLAKRMLHLGGIPLNLAVLAVMIMVLPLVSIASLLYFETPARTWLSRARAPSPSPARSAEQAP